MYLGKNSDARAIEEAGFVIVHMKTKNVCMSSGRHGPVLRDVLFELWVAEGQQKSYQRH